MNGIAVDAVGNTYLAGYTDSRDLPALEHAYQKEPRGYDAFVAKVDAAGRPVWSTYLGGNDARSFPRNPVGDSAEAIALDGIGNVYVAGWTTSTDFPTTGNAFLASPRPLAPPSSDGFFAKLAPDGGRLLYSTYIGAADGSSDVGALAVGPAGEAWLAITTSARQFPVTHDISSAPGVGRLIVMKLTPVGSLGWSTRLGKGDEGFGAMAVDGMGAAHLTGRTTEPRCVDPVPPLGPGCDAVFITKLDASGTRVIYSTSVVGRRSPYLNGIPSTVGLGLAITPDDHAVVTGSVLASDLPTRNAWQPAFGGLTDAFVAVFTPTGGLDTLSYLGGNGDDAVYLRTPVAVDFGGVIHVAIDSRSNDLATKRALVARHLDGPVFTSGDRGAAWQWASAGVAGSVNDLALDADRNALYAATEIGIFRSADQGATWVPRHEGLLIPNGSINQRVGPVDTVAVDPRRSSVLYAGARALFRSVDAGDHWTLLRESGAGVGGFSARFIRVSPHDSSVWVAGGNGIEVSRDGGQTWESRSRGLPTTLVGRIASPTVMVFDSKHPGAVYAGMDGGMFATFDDGGVWSDVTASSLTSFGRPEQPTITAIALDPLNEATIYAGTFNRGILKTTDGGRAWFRVLEFGAIKALEIDSVSPSIVYAGVSDAQEARRIIQSRDAGRTWSTLSNGLTFRGTPTRLLVHPRTPERLYATSFINTLPYIARLSRVQGPPVPRLPSPGEPLRMTALAQRYQRGFASFLADGIVRDIAVRPTGETVLAMHVPSAAREGISIVTIDP